MFVLDTRVEPEIPALANNSWRDFMSDSRGKL